MNSGVVRLDHIMSILITMNNHRLQSLTAVFCFTQAEYNLIKLKLYNN